MELFINIKLFVLPHNNNNNEKKAKFSANQIIVLSPSKLITAFDSEEGNDLLQKHANHSRGKINIVKC